MRRLNCSLAALSDSPFADGVHFIRNWGYAPLQTIFLRQEQMASKKSILALLAFAAISLIYLRSTVVLFQEFPATWTWSELMTSYQGGLVKRSLFGEIAYRLDTWFLPAQWFATTMIFANYVATLAALIFWGRFTTSLAGLLFLISPGIFMFPILEAEAFGRKDAFILAAFVLCVCLIEKLKQTWLLLTLIAVIYVITGAVIEAAWFYFPFVVALFVWRRPAIRLRTDWKIAVCAAFLCLASLIFWSRIGVGFDPIKAALAWQDRYPNAVGFGMGGALCCLSFSLDMALAIGSGQIRDRTLFFGFVTAGLLSFLPVFVLLWQQAPKLGRPSPLPYLIFVCSLASALVPFAVAADWGRYIYLFAAHVFLTVWFASGVHTDNAQSKGKPLSQAAAVIVVFVYGLSWSMAHFEVPGSVPPLRPGILFSGAMQAIYFALPAIDAR